MMVFEEEILELTELTNFSRYVQTDLKHPRTIADGFINMTSFVDIKNYMSHVVLITRVQTI